MKKLILFTMTMFAVGLMFLSPVKAEASGSPGEPTVKACSSCHADVKAEVIWYKADLHKVAVEQVAMEAIVEASEFKPKTSGVVESSRSIYREITRICKTTYYGISKVPI